MVALSLAVRDADESPENLKMLSELYTDFGYRIYSAARPPLIMESFWTDGYEKHFSGRNGMYTSRPHEELRLEQALKYAYNLFRKAVKIGGGHENWKNHYMMGKCLAKLQAPPCNFTREPEDIMQHFVDAIKACPEKSSETIFEPHHKLVSTACKLVFGHELTGLTTPSLTPKRACEILDATKFSKGIDHVEDKADFALYAIEVLKKIKAADKPKWHHRMTNRIARLRYHTLGDVAGARAELQTLFSNKSAQLSIWRPEFERPGRHFVFASQYTMFYVDLLEKLGERATIETVAKRVRRLPHGLFRHLDIWWFTFDRYIKVLRRTCGVGEANQCEEDVFRNVSFDEFSNLAMRLDTYCNNLKDTPCPPLDLLREVFELRKLNAGMAKNTPIDDLLADAYAKLWKELVPGIVAEETAEKQQKTADTATSNPMSLKNMMFDAPEPTPAATTVDAAVAGVARIDLDLPLRAKMTRVTRRELISKATNLCKEMNQTPFIAGVTGVGTGGNTGQSVGFIPLIVDGLLTALQSPRTGVSMIEDTTMTGDEGPTDGEGCGRPEFPTLPNISVE